MPATLDHYLQALRSLNVNRSAGRASPHKPCMLLAVLGLAEAGDLGRNEIRFDPALLERYAKFFAAVQGDTDHPNPYFPFFHLKSERFWHLQPLPGRETVVESMRSATSVSAITANIASASLDPDLHTLVQDEAPRLSRQLKKLDTARMANDMNVPGWKLHPLFAGRWSVWVNGNWRMRFEFEGEDAILVNYKDYH